MLRSEASFGMSVRFEDVHERLLAGCVCEIKLEFNALVVHRLPDLLGGKLPQEETLLGLTVLYTLSEAAQKAYQTKAICPTIQDALVAVVKKEIMGNLLSLQMLSPDKFIAHCSLLVLNSLARCSKDLQEAFVNALGEHLNTLGTDFSSSISSVAEKCLHSMLPCLQKEVPCKTLYPTLCLWLKLVQNYPSKDVLSGLLPQHFVKWSGGDDPLVARTVLEILDKGLQPAIEEAKFSNVPPLVPVIGQQVIEAVHGGWLDKLHCRTGFCGFAGTGKEPSCKYPEQDLAASQGDSRAIRLAVLVFLKSSAACLMKGMQEGIPKALEIGLAWLRSRTRAEASVPDADCLVQLFLDQDDQLIECLLSELLLHLHK
ncbi:hypothetical protein HPB50_005481 [Hyalomma asiaticum]|uniref:Uncharacterized protein n=1 Tax=Hyalomma asiaticum TaxID=266040 RepID=A0ACB7SF75_HYAAI|nr:hypothetical protein HPB50_005481 [Hyalomma asiaticum]